MKISIEAKIGIIVTAAIAVVIWGLNYLKGRNILKPTNEYYAFYEDVGGLDKNAKVYLKGFRIGQVDDIYLDEDDSDLLTVVIGINKPLKIPYKSVAEVFSTDLMGTKAIRIINAGSDQMHKPGDTLLTNYSAGLEQQIQDQIIPLKNKAEKLIVTVDSLLQNLNYIFDEQAKRSLHESILNLERSTGRLDRMLTDDGKLSKMISNIESITSNIQNNNDKIADAISNLSSISDSIAGAELRSAINRANESLDETHQILQKINSGEGNIGLLVNNDSLYYNLESLTGEIDRLMKDLQENPKKYIHVSVFGKSGEKKQKNK
jgi:phospholipid/cholesterol/gamma-HCH transport system substrate-binding protein